MPHLLRRELQHRPRLASRFPFGPKLLRTATPELSTPACQAGRGGAVAGYWRGQALREGLLAAVLTGVLTTTVQAAPQLFTQAPQRSLLDLRALVLSGQVPQPGLPLLDCP